MYFSNCTIFQVLYILLTNPVFGLDTIKTPTNILQTTINGTVTNVQNGQQGPATIIGLPSFLSTKKNIDPTRRAQQQKYLLKSSMVNVKHGLSASVIGPEDDEFNGGSPRLHIRLPRGDRSQTSRPRHRRARRGPARCWGPPCEGVVR